MPRHSSARGLIPRLVHWWRMEAEGWNFAGAWIDLRVGGRYRLGMTDPAGTTHVAVGVYREVQRPVRLVFTWDWKNPANRVGGTLVSVEFKVLGEKRTEIVYPRGLCRQRADGTPRTRLDGVTQVAGRLHRLTLLTKEGGTMTTGDTDYRLFQPSQKQRGMGIVPGRRHGLHQLHDSHETGDRTGGVPRIHEAFLLDDQRPRGLQHDRGRDQSVRVTRYHLQPPAGPLFQSHVAEVFGGQTARSLVRHLLRQLAIPK